MSTPSSAERPHWDQVWLHVAEAVSARSLCTRSKVGAVLVTPAHRVVAVGYNNPPAGFSHRDEPCTAWCQRAAKGAYRDELVKLSVDGLHHPERAVIQTPLTPSQLRSATLDPGYADCPSLHAEANALSVCDRVQREGGTLYVTSHVCHACAKLIANSGLSRVVVSTSAAETAAHRDPERSYDLLRDCGLVVDIELW